MTTSCFSSKILKLGGSEIDSQASLIKKRYSPTLLSGNTGCTLTVGSYNICIQVHKAKYRDCFNNIKTTQNRKTAPKSTGF